MYCIQSCHFHAVNWAIGKSFTEEKNDKYKCQNLYVIFNIFFSVAEVGNDYYNDDSYAMEYNTTNEVSTQAPLTNDSFDMDYDANEEINSKASKFHATEFKTKGQRVSRSTLAPLKYFITTSAYAQKKNPLSSKHNQSQNSGKSNKAGQDHKDEGEVKEETGQDYMNEIDEEDYEVEDKQDKKEEGQEDVDEEGDNYENEDELIPDGSEGGQNEEEEDGQDYMNEIDEEDIETDDEEVGQDYMNEIDEEDVETDDEDEGDTDNEEPIQSVERFLVPDRVM